MRDAVIRPYLELPPEPGRDRYVLPAMKGYLDFDRAMMSPVDSTEAAIYRLVQARMGQDGAEAVVHGRRRR